jgi:hypothetical protein
VFNGEHDLAAKLVRPPRLGRTTVAVFAKSVEQKYVATAQVKLGLRFAAPAYGLTVGRTGFLKVLESAPAWLAAMYSRQDPETPRPTINNHRAARRSTQLADNVAPADGTDGSSFAPGEGVLIVRIGPSCAGKNVDA